ncbi:MAG: VWA-like domain-containing protein [Lachnospiraceae bacterium]|nr:VWA-like domain-containing protein [Lachnospiraceae bacterium]
METADQLPKYARTFDGHYADLDDMRRRREAHDLAKDILRLSRNTILLNFRFLESALLEIRFGEESATPEIATDGRSLFYHSDYLCRQFQRSPAIVNRNYLHLVLHCVFRHLFVDAQIDRELWDLSCDIMVENIIAEQNVKTFFCEREERQQWLIARLKEDLPALTAERIYRHFRESGLEKSEMTRLREYFYADDHEFWYGESSAPDSSDGGKRSDRTEDAKETPPEMGEADSPGGAEPPEPDGEDVAQTDTGGGDPAGEKQDSGDGGGLPSDGNRKEDTKDRPALSPEELKRRWQEISERIRVELDTMPDTWGSSDGNLIQALREINRERYDYAEFLRKFSVLGENIEVNDDEFDPILYTWAMKRYGRMPLIEPLESKEVRKVREFVIALDTSQSVAGEVVQAFVTKTCIMKQSENFFTTVNVHIIQCGARVEEDQKITSQEEFDRYMEGMTLKGFGGTDFRPVFTYVDGLLRRHEFSNLRGMIYFTDGYGTYPAMPPEYDTAFVFLDTGREVPEVPHWAMKVVLREDSVLGVC